MKTRWPCVATTLLLLCGLTQATPALPRSPGSESSRKFVVGQAINTTSGVVHGTHAANHFDVSLYAGIPFAKPPVGELRWASPQAFRGSGMINATQFGSGCASNSVVGSATSSTASISIIAGPAAVNDLLASGGSGTQSEDCLTLNVWTRPQGGEKKKAVLVWIYGGGFQFGNTNNVEYDGEFFVKNQDIVFVSLNYRTNVFGFPGLPVEGAAQNPGLEDQRLAIEWVRDNIEQFGGDVERITIFGESAGSASVDYYNYAYVDDPIIAGSIGESGTARSFFDPPRLNNTAAWFNMSETLGCGDESVGAEASIACLRGKSTMELLNATLITDPLKFILGNFGPTADGKVVFQDYVERGKAGNFIQKPLFIGNNNYEAGIFKFLAAGVQPPISDNDWDIFNLVIFTCPTADAAAVRAMNGVPVWRYRFFGEFPNTRITQNPDSGAYHSSEISTVFGDAALTSKTTNTLAELGISLFMNKAWADFAKDPANAFDRIYDWPKYNANRTSLIYFGVNNQTQPIIVPPENTDLSCSTIQSLLGMSGGVNALTTDPEGFTANFGGIADQLTGLVGIGQSNHSDTPYGPPPIAPPVPASVNAVAESLSSQLSQQTAAPVIDRKWKRIAADIRATRERVSTGHRK